MSELKACPFCGDDKPRWSGLEAAVECDACLGYMRAATVGEAVTKWNRRAPTVEATKEELEMAVNWFEGKPVGVAAVGAGRFFELAAALLRAEIERRGK